MRLQRLRVEQLRRFREPLELDGLAPGLNLVTGPNESGKSTLVRAIRAAFFERYRSASVSDLQPWGDEGASPSVELEFETGGRHYRLHKSFLGRKRCRLQVDGQALENDEAEQHLCELLGFQLSSKGASRAEHWGIPGLLWIEQGTAHQIEPSVRFATDHLRTALQGSLGEVASTAGDDVLARVLAERAELMTDKTGRPRGAWAEALAQQEALQGQQAELRQRLAAYRSQVDRLGALQAEIALDEAERPWEPLRAQAQAAQQRLDEAQAAGERLQREREQLAPLQRQVELLEQDLARFEAQQAQLAQRRQALAAARQAQETADARLAPAQRRRHDAQAAHAQALAVLERARARQLRATLQREQAAARQRLEALDHALLEAGRHGEELAQLRAQAPGPALDAVQLKALRAAEQRLRELELRRQSAATQLRWHLEPGAAARLDGHALAGAGEQLLLQAAELVLPGVGRLHVVPGGAELAPLAAQHAQAAADFDAMLRRLGVASVDEAEARRERARALAEQLALREALLAQLAPQGTAALQAERAALAGRLQSLQAQLAPGDAAAGEGDLPDATGAEQAAQAAQRELAQADTQAQQAQSALERARADVAHAGREAQVLEQALDAEAPRVARARAERLALLQERERRHALLLAQQAALEATRPELLRQDVQRLSRSADAAWEAYQQRRAERRELQVRLDEAGAQGLEDELAALEAQIARAARRCAELSRRARALELLAQLLQQRRRELTRRLQAPLQKHLNRYLDLLFPGARVDLDEALLPGPLSRGEGAGAFEQLSFGAREQMGLVARLAYADLLQEAGRPTLVLLDDALVHSDASRLAAMKRILFDAATRHQILVFSCHPEAWRDLGVAPRRLQAAAG